MAAHGRERPTRLRIPSNDEAVRTARGQSLTVRAPGHTEDPDLVSFHAGELGAANRVPNLHEPVHSSGRQSVSLGTPGQSADPVFPGRAEPAGFMGLEYLDLRTGLDRFDYTNRPVRRAGGQTDSVRAPRHRPDRAVVRREGEDFPAEGNVPDLDRAVQAARRQVLAVRVPRQRPDQPELLRDSTCVVCLERGKNFFTCCRVPDPDLAVVAARREALAVRAPGNRRRPDDVSRQDARLLVADRVPEPYAAVVAPGGQAAVRAPGQ